MSTLQILRDALKLIENPDHWTQHTAARDDMGNPVFPDSVFARSWCTTGALYSVSKPGNSYSLIEEAQEMLRFAMDHPIHIGFYNDRHSHEDIVLLFKKAIAHLEEKPSE